MGKGLARSCRVLCEYGNRDKTNGSGRVMLGWMEKTPCLSGQRPGYGHGHVVRLREALLRIGALAQEWEGGCKVGGLIG